MKEKKDIKKEIEIKKEEGKKEIPKEGKLKEKIEKKKLAVIRIRGQIRIKKNIRDTLSMLNLYKKHFCVVVENSPGVEGMIRKVKDYVTWGEISENVLKELLVKRAEKNPRDEKRTKKFFRLAPPKGGFERKGIKVSFNRGGALGYRSKEIDNLLKKMM